MSSLSSPAPYEFVLRVETADIDELGHVNNIVYLRWVQEAAATHWRVLSSAEEQAEIVWVALRHEIDYTAPALPGDEVLVRTWVGTASGLSFERHTDILRAADRRQLARARTLWCPISTRTRRPERISADLRARVSVPKDTE